jgi:hypothetical protein
VDVRLARFIFASRPLWLGIRYCVARYRVENRSESFLDRVMKKLLRIRDERNPAVVVERIMRIDYALILQAQGRLISGWHAGHEFGGCDLCYPLRPREGGNDSRYAGKRR